MNFNNLTCKDNVNDLSVKEEHVDFWSPKSGSQDVAVNLQKISQFDCLSSVEDPNQDSDNESEQPKNLKRHITHYAREKSYQCPYCEYKAAEAGTLKQHIMAHHTGEKPHQCPHCEYKAVQKSNLRTHIMGRHMGEKHHQCPHCDYKAVKAMDLKVHIMARHTGERPHQCPHCEYKAVQKSNLRTHIMARHTGEKPHQCAHCNYKSVKAFELKAHIMALHTGEKPRQCPYCEYILWLFIQERSLVNALIVNTYYGSSYRRESSSMPLL